jgi:hypothetical protein
MTGPPDTSIAKPLLRPAEKYANALNAAPQITSKVPPIRSRRQEMNTPSTNVIMKTANIADSTVNGPRSTVAEPMPVSSQNTASSKPTPRAIHRIEFIAGPPVLRASTTVVLACIRIGALPAWSLSSPC